MCVKMGKRWRDVVVRMPPKDLSTMIDNLNLKLPRCVCVCVHTRERERESERVCAG